jgi:hypothetical protein
MMYPALPGPFSLWIRGLIGDQLAGGVRILHGAAVRETPPTDTFDLDEGGTRGG